MEKTENCKIERQSFFHRPYNYQIASLVSKHHFKVTFFLPGILQFLPEEPAGQEHTLGPTHLPNLQPPLHLAKTEVRGYRNKH
jgi:hypothetical protein